MSQRGAAEHKFRQVLSRAAVYGEKRQGLKYLRENFRNEAFCLIPAHWGADMCLESRRASCGRCVIAYFTCDDGVVLKVSCGLELIDGSQVGKTHRLLSIPPPRSGAHRDTPIRAEIVITKEALATLNSCGVVVLGDVRISTEGASESPRPTKAHYRVTSSGDGCDRRSPGGRVSCPGHGVPGGRDILVHVDDWDV